MIGTLSHTVANHSVVAGMSSFASSASRQAEQPARGEEGVKRVIQSAVAIEPRRFHVGQIVDTKVGQARIEAVPSAGVSHYRVRYIMRNACASLMADSIMHVGAASVWKSINSRSPSAASAVAPGTAGWGNPVSGLSSSSSSSSSAASAGSNAAHRATHTSNGLRVLGVAPAPGVFHSHASTASLGSSTPSTSPAPLSVSGYSPAGSVHGSRAWGWSASTTPASAAALASATAQHQHYHHQHPPLAMAHSAAAPTYNNPVSASGWPLATPAGVWQHSSITQTPQVPDTASASAPAGTWPSPGAQLAAHRAVPPVAQRPAKRGASDDDLEDTSLMLRREQGPGWISFPNVHDTVSAFAASSGVARPLEAATTAVGAFVPLRQATVPAPPQQWQHHQQQAVEDDDDLEDDDDY